MLLSVIRYLVQLRAIQIWNETKSFGSFEIWISMPIALSELDWKWQKVIEIWIRVFGSWIVIIFVSVIVMMFELIYRFLLFFLSRFSFYISIRCSMTCIHSKCCLIFLTTPMVFECSLWIFKQINCFVQTYLYHLIRSQSFQLTYNILQICTVIIMNGCIK